MRNILSNELSRTLAVSDHHIVVTYELLGNLISAARLGRMPDGGVNLNSIPGSKLMTRCNRSGIRSFKPYRKGFLNRQTQTHFIYFRKARILLYL